MRNTFAKHITIGLTTLSMTLTSLSGAGSFALTASAEETATGRQLLPVSPSGTPVDGTDKEWEGATIQDYYRKGMGDNTEITYHTLTPGQANPGQASRDPKLGSDVKWFQGAKKENPDYSEAEAKGYYTDPVSGRYTFSIMQPKYDIVTGSYSTGGTIDEYIVFSVSENDSLEKKNVYATLMKGRSAVSTYTIEPNGKPGFINFEEVSLATTTYKYLSQDGTIDGYNYPGLASSNATPVLDNRFNIRNMYDGIYFTGMFNASRKSNGAVRMFTLDKTLLSDPVHMQTVTEAIPTKATQTTTYVGINENGERQILDTYVIEGMSGQSYTIPGPNTYSGWRLVKAPLAEERNGMLGNPYPKGYRFFDNPVAGYLREWEVVDDNQSVTQKIYRELESGDSRTGRDGKGPFTNPEDGKAYICVDVQENIKLGETTRESYRSKLDGEGEYPGGKWGRLSYHKVDQIIGVRNPIPYAPKDVEYVYEPIPARLYSPENPGIKSEGSKGTIKKALELNNIVQDYIPSVPDVIFNYEIVYSYGNVVSPRYPDDKDFPESLKSDSDRMYEYDFEYEKVVKAIDADGNKIYETDADGKYVWTLSDRGIVHKYSPIAHGVDVNGTKFEVWRGPVGGLEIADSAKDYAEGKSASYSAEGGYTGTMGDDGSIRFHHDDNASANTDGTGMGLAVADTDEDKDGSLITKRLPFIINENVFKAAGVYRYDIVETGMTEWDESAEAGKEQSKVLDDIEEKQGEIRYLDVYVEWNANEDGLIIKDMVLHNIEEDLDYEKHGDYNLNGEGESKDGSKTDRFTTSLYTTYDLVIGKEVSGKGLTNHDTKEREYVFTLNLDAPSHTVIEMTLKNSQTDVLGKPGTQYTFDTKGEIAEFELKLKANEYVVLSGLPNGSSYTIEEKEIEDAVFWTYAWVDALNTVGNGNSHRNEAQKVAFNEIMNVSGKRNDGVALLMQNETEQNRSAGSMITYRTKDESMNNVFFLNYRPDNVVTGVAMNVLPYALMVFAAMVGIGGFLVIRRRRADAEK